MRVTMMTIKTPFLSTTDKNRGKEGREEEGTQKHRHHRHHRHQAHWNRAWPLNRNGSGEVQPHRAGVVTGALMCSVRVGSPSDRRHTWPA